MWYLDIVQTSWSFYTHVVFQVSARESSTQRLDNWARVQWDFENRRLLMVSACAFIYLVCKLLFNLTWFDACSQCLRIGYMKSFVVAFMLFWFLDFWSSFLVWLVYRHYWHIWRTALALWCCWFCCEVWGPGFLSSQDQILMFWFWIFQMIYPVSSPSAVIFLEHQSFPPFRVVCRWPVVHQPVGIFIFHLQAVLDGWLDEGLDTKHSCTAAGIVTLVSVVSQKWCNVTWFGFVRMPTSRPIVSHFPLITWVSNC